MSTHSSSNFSLSSSPYRDSNTIDLTLDDDIENEDPHNGRVAKRLRTEYSPSPLTASSTTHLPFQSHGSTPTSSPPTSAVAFVNGHHPAAFPLGPQPVVSLNQYRPAFAGPSSLNISPTHQQRPASSASPAPSTVRPPTVESDRQIIDLTGSPSPPPISQARHLVPPALPVELPPKTPVCIGLLTVTALVLYPVPYLYSQHPNSNEAEWAPVRLHYDHNPNKPGGSETIHIRTPHVRGLNGEVIEGEGFGVVEQKVATALGPMLGKGLIRLDAKVRKGLPNVSNDSCRILVSLATTT
jgi:SWI/SNF-related matrix-associated actin-dependent regulator of chromatin subfamily A3